MNYTETNNNVQPFFEASNNFFKIPCTLDRFINTETLIGNDPSGHECYIFKGKVHISDKELTCECCGSKMYVHQTYPITIKHLPFGPKPSCIQIDRIQLKCSNCGKLKLQEIPFKDDNHMITKQLRIYIEDLLSTSKFTNKEISYITGVNRNIIKEIDKERLNKKYTIDGKGKELIKPKEYAEFLGIDEFKLHNGYKYATHIIDYKTGHILWIKEGKKKNVVYKFMEFVGEDWMHHVVAVACDMNSDFEEAFKERYPHIKIVYDYFHITKNFNDKVVSAIRKDEQKRLESIGDMRAAKELKGSRFILTSKIETLEKKDLEAQEGKIISNGSELFETSDVKRKGGYVSRYNQLINNNELFLTIELIKELLMLAYKSNDEEEMAEYIFEIMELCEDNGNTHLIWFLKLLYSHLDGILTHSTYKISSGKIEGINNKIKTLRRQAYGYPDDEYFFLKLFDASRN